MKKELILAILIGLIVGLVIVFGVYRTRTIFTPKNQSTRLEVSPTPEASADALNNLLIHSPEDETIQESADVTIAGTTNAGDFVVILVNETEHITSADGSGNFSISTQLESGSNIIQVSSINEDGLVTTEELTVIYTTRPLLESSSASTEVSSGEEN